MLSGLSGADCCGIVGHDPTAEGSGNLGGVERLSCCRSKAGVVVLVGDLLKELIQA